jgi:hypothetical protein
MSGSFRRLRRGERRSTPGQQVNLTNLVENAQKLSISGGTIHFVSGAEFDGPGFDVGETTLDGRLTGTATLSIESGDHNGSALEVSGSVSRGLNFLFVGSMSENSLKIDDTSKFRGLITAHFIPNDLDPQFGFVDCVGIHATSANIHDDILQMFDGKKLVDTTRIDIGDGKGIQLQQNSQGVILLGGANPADIPDGPGTPVPTAYLVAGVEGRRGRCSRALNENARIV